MSTLQLVERETNSPLLREVSRLVFYHDYYTTKRLPESFGRRVWGPHQPKGERKWLS